MLVEDFYTRQFENGNIDIRRFVDLICDCKEAKEDDLWRQREFIYELFREV